MEIPVITMDQLYGEKRSETLSLLHNACAQWGFFWVSGKICIIVLMRTISLSFLTSACKTVWQLENHGVNEDLMNKMKGLVNKHYEQDMEKNFYSSEMAKIRGYEKGSSNVDCDWECSFMYHHQPKSNSHNIPKLLR